jgi:hypothetical protein
MTLYMGRDKVESQYLSNTVSFLCSEASYSPVLRQSHGRVEIGYGLWTAFDLADQSLAICFTPLDLLSAN